MTLLRTAGVFGWAALVVSGCYDTGQAYPIAQAKAAYEQVPLLTEEAYLAARQEALQSSLARPPQGENRDSNDPDLGLAPDARLSLGVPCDQILKDPQGRRVRLVAAFRDGLPSNDLIRQTRLYQDEVAACFTDQGIEVSFHTRTNQDDVPTPSQIQLYFY